MFKLIIINIFTLLALADEIKIATSYLPPYVFRDNFKGIEIEIVHKALSYKGHTFKNFDVPFKRLQIMSTQSFVQGAITQHKDRKTNAFYSNDHIYYQNIVVSLKKNKFKLNSIEDLKDKSIATFQDSREILGKKYAQTIANNKVYFELANQINQIHMLYNERIDFIILDKNIFYYLRNNASKYMDVSKEVVIHSIFPKSYFSVAFKDKKIRDEFNEGLEMLKSSGEYDQIYRRYEEKYQKIQKKIN